MANKDFFSDEFFLEAIDKLVENKDNDTIIFEDNSINNFDSKDSYKEKNIKGPKLSMKNLLKNTSMYNEDKDDNSAFTADNTYSSPFFQGNKGSTKSINDFLKTPLPNKYKAPSSKFYMSSTILSSKDNFDLKGNSIPKEPTIKFSNNLLKGYKDKIQMMKQSELVKLQVITEDKHYTPILSVKKEEINDLDNKFHFTLS